MYLLLAVLLQAAPVPTPDPRLKEARAAVVKGLDRFDATVDEFAGFIGTRFAADSDEPKTGLAVSSPEDVDAAGLHPLIVETVITDSPADRAGILPGDRVVRIGQRRIEHETPQVFRVLTDGAPGIITVEVLRSGTPLTLTVDRKPIACLQKASASIDQKKWQDRIKEFRALSAMARSGLDDRSTPEIIRYTAGHDHVRQLFSVFDEFGSLMSLELAQAMMTHCRFESKK